MECPSCHSILTVAGRIGQTPHRGGKAVSETPRSDVRPVASVAAPRRLTTTGRDSPPALPKIDAGDDHAITTGIGQAGIDAIYAFRRKRRWWTPLVAGVMALALVGGLFFLVSWIVGEQARQASGAGAEPSVSGESGPVADLTKPGVLEESLPSADTAPTPPELPPKPVRVFAEPEFFGRLEWDQVWRRINGYMVRLEIATPAGTREATGMIVDSRGWVVTSLSALADAMTVKVTVAAKRLQDDPQWLDLSDLSRGLLASDRQYDLAIISINRAQVINLTDPNLESLDNMVSAQRFLLARTPPPDQASWITEARIEARPTVTDADEAVQNLIRKNGLAVDESFRWIVASLARSQPVSAQCAGSPLVDEQGRVFAFGTGWSADGNLVAVPAHVVARLLKSIDTSSQIQPFPGNHLTGHPGDGSKSVPVAIDESAPLDPFAAAVAEAEKGIQACRQTDWTADNAAEYTAFQRLSRTIYELQDLAAVPADVDEQEARREQLRKLFDEIESSLGPDLERADFDEGKSNRWFAKAISPENPWCVLAVTVERNAIETPSVGGEDAVRLRLHGTNETVVARPGVEGPVFQTGRRFLIFARVDMNRNAAAASRESGSMVRLIDIHAAFWINLRDNR
jgi:S1-C subfamily serine protease